MKLAAMLLSLCLPGVAAAEIKVLQGHNYIALPADAGTVAFNVPSVRTDHCLEVRSSYGYPSGRVRQAVEGLRVSQQVGAQWVDMAWVGGRPERDVVFFPLYFRFAKTALFGANFRLETKSGESFSALLTAVADPLAEERAEGIVILSPCPAG